MDKETKAMLVRETSLGQLIVCALKQSGITEGQAKEVLAELLNLHTRLVHAIVGQGEGWEVERTDPGEPGGREGGSDDKT